MKRKEFLRAGVTGASLVSAAALISPSAFAQSPDFDLSLVQASDITLKINRSYSRPDLRSLQAHTYDEKGQLQAPEILFEGDVLTTANGQQSWIFQPSKHLFLNFDAIPQSCDGHVIFAKNDKYDHSFAIAKYLHGKIQLLKVCTAADFLDMFDDVGCGDSPWIYHSAFQPFQNNDEISVLVGQSGRLCAVSLENNGTLRTLFQIDGTTPLNHDGSIMYSGDFTVTGPYYNLTGDHKNTYFFHHDTLGLTLCHVTQNGLVPVTTFATGHNAPAALESADGTWSWNYNISDTYLYCLQNVGADKHSVVAFQTSQGLLHFTLQKNNDSNTYSAQFVHLLNYADEVHDGWAFQAKDKAASVVGHATDDSHDFVLLSSDTKGWALYRFDTDAVGAFQFSKVMGRIVDEPTSADANHCFELGDGLKQENRHNETAKKREHARTQLFSQKDAPADAHQNIYVRLHHFQPSQNYYVFHIALAKPQVPSVLLTAQSKENQTDHNIKIEKVTLPSASPQKQPDQTHPLSPQDMQWLGAIEKKYQETRQKNSDNYAAGHAFGYQMGMLIYGVEKLSNMDDIKNQSKTYAALISDLKYHLHEEVNGDYGRGFDDGVDSGAADAEKFDKIGDSLISHGCINMLVGSAFFAAFYEDVVRKPDSAGSFKKGAFYFKIFMVFAGGTAAIVGACFKNRSPWGPSGF